MLQPCGEKKDSMLIDKDVLEVNIEIKRFHKYFQSQDFIIYMNSKDHWDILVRINF